MPKLFALVLTLLLLAGQAIGAAGYVTTTVASGTADPMTALSVTVSSGTNFILIQFSLNGHTVDAGSVTRDGQSATKITNNGVSNKNSEVWYIASPNVGTADLNANFSGSTAYTCRVIHLSGINTSDPYGTVQSDVYSSSADTSHSCNTTGVADGLIVDLFTFGDYAQTLTKGASQTLIGTQTGPGSDHTEASSYRTGTGATAMSWSWTSGFVPWSHISVPLKPAATGTSTGLLLRGVQ